MNLDESTSSIGAKRAVKATARRSAADRTEQLLSVSEQLLLTGGFAAFSMRQVAGASEVSLATLQYYFRTREVLLTATIARALDRWRAGFEAAALDASRPPVERLRELLRLNLEYVFHDRAAPMLLETFALARHEAFAQKLIGRAYVTYRRIITALIVAIEPTSPASDAFAMATVIASHMEGMLVFSSDDDPIRKDEMALRKAIDLFAIAIACALKSASGRS